MSREWTEEELQSASKAMKSAGHLGYEEFFANIRIGLFSQPTARTQKITLLQSVANITAKKN